MANAAVESARHHPQSFAAPVASETPTATPTPDPVVRYETVTETAPVAFDRVTVDDATRAAGTTAVTTAGVDGELTRVYRVTYTDDVETARELQTETVSRAPVAEVTSRGTYVAPPAPRYVAPAPAAPAPPASSGGTVNPGGYCGNVGATGVAANGKTYTCGAKGPDANGKYHWNA
ncbi:hypothetical protein FJ657_03610 [Schumannella soli]|uniref:G5 domain-containing protein n=1 Tax=Schumannella soli TaxID=2590779 RepID=A0A506XZ25_9MICO|nr:hypothetical protein FJ657_03610 [Schumannella soli]